MIIRFSLRFFFVTFKVIKVKSISFNNSDRTANFEVFKLFFVAHIRIVNYPIASNSKLNHLVFKQQGCKRHLESTSCRTRNLQYHELELEREL